MEWFDSSALSLAVFLPLAGAIVIAALPVRFSRLAALLFTLVPLLVGVGMLARFDYGAGAAMQFEVSRSWIPSIGAGYHVGVDGIALPLLVLSLLLSLLCVVYSWRILPEPRNPKAFLALLLLLETGMNGTFAALDLVLFFVFWETVLIPMYFLIAVWGGPRSDYASIKFILYTLIGSVVMLLGFLALWLRSSPEAAGRTFDMLALQDVGPARFGGTFGTVVFAAVALGFAVKVPVWPLHTWLPDAHTEAPTVGSVLLAGILLKMGTYGFVRIALPILPEAARTWAPVLGVLGAIAIIYGSLCCLAQRDVKRLIAYSSVGHMGFVLLGIATLTPTGANASLIGNVAHGLITGLLFFLIGGVKDRYHTSDLVELGSGLSARLPRLGALIVLAAVASLGLPGLAGFWGEAFALLASFRPAPDLSRPLFVVLLAVAAVGSAITTAYFLRLLRSLVLGPDIATGALAVGGAADVRPIELLAWAPLAVLTIVVGLYPRLVLDLTEGPVRALLAVYGG